MTKADHTLTLARKRMAAALLFCDRAGRALLVEPVCKSYWELVGGAVEQDESPMRAAAREAREELGIALVPGRLLVVDWVPPHPGRSEGLSFVYDGGSRSEQEVSRIRLPRDELGGWEWCNQKQIEQRMSPLLARRVTAAMDAKAHGLVYELENGYNTGSPGAVALAR